jgi:AraC family transcriptional activator of pyochelin receptor
MESESQGSSLPLNVQYIPVKIGLQLVLVDMRLKEPLLVDFETNEAPFEFSFHLSGQTRYRVLHQKGEETFTGKPGVNIAAALSGSYSTMEIMDDAHIRMVALQVEPSFFHQYLEELRDINVSELEDMLQKDSLPFYLQPSEMTPSMSLVANQILACPYHGLARKMYYESKTLELMVLQLTKLANKASGRDGHTLFNQEERERIRTARRILLDDLENPPSLLQLARMVGLTHTKLNKGFRAEYGTTVFDYLRQFRLEESRKLLDLSDMNVAEIAYATGFSSPSHFAKAFVAYFGVQPKAYQKEIRSRRTLFLSTK